MHCLATFVVVNLSLVSSLNVVSHTTPTFCSLSLSRLQRVKPVRAATSPAHQQCVKSKRIFERSYIRIRHLQ
jgi:hypothetical protein